MVCDQIANKLFVLLNASILGNIAKNRLCDLQVMPGARIAWVGGINKFWEGGTKNFNTSNPRVWTKKKRSSSQNQRGFYKFWDKNQKKLFISKKCANFHELRGETTKKRGLYYKICKKQFLLTNSGVLTCISGVSGLELHFSGTKPVTFFGHNPRLGGTILVWGTFATIWRSTVPESPRGVGPTASFQQFIEL